jgi:hypothetical protein
MAENLEGVKATADVVIVKDSSLEDLYEKLDVFITEYVR